MTQILDIRFIGMEPSEAVASAAQEKATKLELFCPEITACRVAVELPHRHRRQGRSFAVRIDVTLPGHELAVSRIEDEDVYVALRDAFDGMTRQLDETMRRKREPARRPVSPPKPGLNPDGSTS